MACSWNISKSEGKSKDHPTPRQGTSCILLSPPLGATCLTWLRGFPLSVLSWASSPPLICSWSLLGPYPEGRSHRPPERQEGAGGGSLPGGGLKAIWGGSRTCCVCRLGTAAYLSRAGDSDRHLFPLSPLGSLSPGTWSELDFRSWKSLLRALLQLSLADFNL